MRKMIQVEREQWTCDGCQYLMNAKDPMITVSVPFDFPFEWLRGEKGETLNFHFHALGHRHDCFRYWAHNPKVMEQSLKDRGLDNEERDDFMALMLYRENTYSPGVERPKAIA